MFTMAGLDNSTMNLNDTITEILKISRGTLILGTVPDQEGSGFFAVANIAVQTGNRGNYVEAKCQRTGANVVECLENVLLDIKHTADLKEEPSKILRPPRTIKQ